jgi:uncharacterized protein
MERRFTHNHPVKLEARAEGDTTTPKIIGTGAVYYDGTPQTEYELWNFGSERCVERILPGAFDKAISRPDDCRGLFNHDPDNVLGRTASGTMRLTTDEKGLQYEIDPDDTSISKDVQRFLARGDVTGSSIAFTVDEERWTETKKEDESWEILREIISVTLYDAGPVTYPAYTSTTSGLRAAGDIDEAKTALQNFRSKNKPTFNPSAIQARARVVELIESGALSAGDARPAV